MHMLHRQRRWPFFIAKFIVFAIVGVAALGWVVMSLWNWLVPNLFISGSTITYWQALGLFVLSRILFGGLRGHGGRHGWHHRRWERMTPEEREKFRAGMRRCFGDGETKGAAEGDAQPPRTA